MRKFLPCAIALLISTTAIAETESSDSSSSELNKYKEQFIIGQDDNIPVFPLTFGPDGFQTILGWNNKQVKEFREQAVKWFKDRFGIDFTNGTETPLGGLTINFAIGSATMNPLSFEGAYRVELSTTSKLPAFKHGKPTFVQLVEFVATFSPDAVFTFTGTYAPGGVPGDPNANLAFGCYLVGGEFHFFMKSDIPASVDASGRSREVLLLHSPTFGEGLSIMNVGISFIPDKHGNFPTYIHALWSFPGSFVIPEYNSYKKAPIKHIKP